VVFDNFFKPKLDRYTNWHNRTPNCLPLIQASRIGPRPTYQYRALRLVRKGERAFPEEVEITFKGKSVIQLTMTHIILWNSGKAMLEGKNIVTDDPLRLEFNKPAEILRARVLKSTRESNKFKVEINPSSSNVVVCSFDYLDPGDGVVIELLHTVDDRFPKIMGTIRGVPKGVLNWGRIIPSRRRTLPYPFKSNKAILLFLFCIGMIYV
jgi:hypothetical protein